VSVRYADVDIGGSPFYAEVFDPDQVRVSNIPQTAVRDQPINFDGRTISRALEKSIMNVFVTGLLNVIVTDMFSHDAYGTITDSIDFLSLQATGTVSSKCVIPDRELPEVVKTILPFCT